MAKTKKSKGSVMAARGSMTSQTSGGSDAGRGRPTTIAKSVRPTSGKPVRTHPLSKGMPGSGMSTSFRVPSQPVPMPNPNKFQRDRMDSLAVTAHAHTSVAAPIKAAPINKRPGDSSTQDMAAARGGKKAGKVVSPSKRSTVDPMVKNATATRKRGY